MRLDAFMFSQNASTTCSSLENAPGFTVFYPDIFGSYLTEAQLMPEVFSLLALQVSES